MKERLLAYLPNRMRYTRIPKESVGVLPFMLISFELGISIVFGYIAARFFAGSSSKTQGRAPSLIFPVGKYTIHMHHWLIFLGALVITLLANLLFTTPPIFYGFLVGAIVTAGYFFAYSLGAAQIKKQEYLIPRVSIFGKYSIPIHHWLIFFGMLAVTAVFTLFFTAPSIFYGFLGGVIAQGIFVYEDWPRIVSRKN
ncbi:MAG TPA: hypothetical protein ENI04_00520 [Candidatus Wildermuthbacteria bacterium]|nr:hypothetical protein [Candidatus Wildermuthbacteria bacterium]